MKTPSQRPRRRRWPRALLITTALVVAGLAFAIYAPLAIRVIDGDTLVRGGIRHRLVGFDAPEIRTAHCQIERARGQVAKSRLEFLLAKARHVELKPTRRPDRYGRVLSRLTIDGEDVAAIAWREGWGEPYNGRGPRPDWCSLAPRQPPPSE